MILRLYRAQEHFFQLTGSSPSAIANNMWQVFSMDEPATKERFDAMWAKTLKSMQKTFTLKLQRPISDLHRYVHDRLERTFGLSPNIGNHLDWFFSWPKG